MTRYARLKKDTRFCLRYSKTYKMTGRRDILVKSGKIVDISQYSSIAIYNTHYLFLYDPKEFNDYFEILE